MRLKKNILQDSEMLVLIMMDLIKIKLEIIFPFSDINVKGIQVF